ncbi:uncharacterized protein FA14DRAFT_179618 [Meira miltonrushii]|uniref:Ribosomal RNA-processing protein 14/surfeit locus protein 6 C-terminal domain-containing protein n=1 Tax=Meira miltonrushii TaxID=1280837 RepID=A0A316VGU6_9BASI|nr:uncharacterized protein FA14DRAFT_179618 [Meira miltonrushii]PWN36258.1 hypothetical protein FA14DRAFT_179618 [Meira miltonrushii]
MFLIWYIALICVQHVVQGTGDDQNYPSGRGTSAESDFDWTSFIDWPSSPETVPKEIPASVSYEHHAPEPSKPTSQSKGLDRERKKAYNHEYYQKQKSDPQLWRKRLDDQKLNRLIKIKRETAYLARLNQEDREAILRERKEKRKQRLLKAKNTSIEKEKKLGGQKRDLSPEAKKRRRAINRKAVQKYRKNLKERASSQQNGNTAFASDGDRQASSPASEEGSAGSNFDWMTLIDWASSPKTTSEQIDQAQSTDHPTPQPDQRHRDRAKMRAYNNDYYLKYRKNPDLWKTRLEGQKLNRLKNMKKKKAAFEQLSQEDKEAILTKQRQKRKERYLRDKSKNIKLSGAKSFIRDLSPESKKRRRAINREASKRYRRNLKERARKQQDDNPAE